MAEALATKGYLVLAVDLYGTEPATTTNDARQLMSSYDIENGISNMNGAVNFLLENNVESIGSIGWCFGGGQSLNLALNNQDMDATVIYPIAPSSLARSSPPPIAVRGFPRDARR